MSTHLKIPTGLILKAPKLAHNGSNKTSWLKWLKDALFFLNVFFVLTPYSTRKNNGDVQIIDLVSRDSTPPHLDAGDSSSGSNSSSSSSDPQVKTEEKTQARKFSDLSHRDLIHAAYLIVSTLDEILTQATAHLSASQLDDIWEVIMLKTTKNLLMERFRRKKEIFNMTMPKNQSVSSFTSKLEQKVDQLHSMSSSVKIDEEDKCGIVLTAVQTCSRKEVFEITVDLILNMAKISYPDIKSRLLSIEANKPSSSRSAPSAPLSDTLKEGEYINYTSTHVKTIIPKDALATIDCKWFMSPRHHCKRGDTCLFKHDPNKKDSQALPPLRNAKKSSSSSEKKHDATGKSHGHRYPDRERKQKKCETCGTAHAKDIDCPEDFSDSEAESVDFLLEELGLSADAGAALHETFQKYKDFMVRGCVLLLLLLALLFSFSLWSSLSQFLFSVSNILSVSLPSFSVTNPLFLSCVRMYVYIRSVVMYRVYVSLCMCIGISPLYVSESIAPVCYSIVRDILFRPVVSKSYDFFSCLTLIYSVIASNISIIYNIFVSAVTIHIMPALLAMLLLIYTYILLTHEHTHVHVHNMKCVYNTSTRMRARNLISGKPLSKLDSCTVTHVTPDDSLFEPHTVRTLTTHIRGNVNTADNPTD
jgi:hypothetical protein